MLLKRVSVANVEDSGRSSQELSELMAPNRERRFPLKLVVAMELTSKGRRKRSD